VRQALMDASRPSARGVSLRKHPRNAKLRNAYIDQKRCRKAKRNAAEIESETRCAECERAAVVAIVIDLASDDDAPTLRMKSRCLHHRRLKYGQPCVDSTQPLSSSSSSSSSASCFCREAGCRERARFASPGSDEPTHCILHFTLDDLPLPPLARRKDDRTSGGRTVN